MTFVRATGVTKWPESTTPEVSGEVALKTCRNSGGLEQVHSKAQVISPVLAEALRVCCAELAKIFEIRPGTVLGMLRCHGL